MHAYIPHAADLLVPVRTPARQRSADKLEQRGRLCAEAKRWIVPKSRWLFVDGTAAELF